MKGEHKKRDNRNFFQIIPLGERNKHNPYFPITKNKRRRYIYRVLIFGFLNGIIFDISYPEKSLK